MTNLLRMLVAPAVNIYSVPLFAETLLYEEI